MIAKRDIYSTVELADYLGVKHNQWIDNLERTGHLDGVVMNFGEIYERQYRQNGAKRGRKGTYYMVSLEQALYLVSLAKNSAKTLIATAALIKYLSEKGSK